MRDAGMFVGRFAVVALASGFIALGAVFELAAVGFVVGRGIVTIMLDKLGGD